MQRGCKVRLILDTQCSKSPDCDAAKLAQAGAQVFTLSGKFSSQSNNTGLMHDKFAVIDRQSVLCGSLNWTRQACLSNMESYLFLTDASLASEYSKRFETMLHEATPL